MAEPVKAAGGIVYNRNGNKDNPYNPLILLIYRREKWDLPKGKMEADETKSECAVREVAEELGVSTPEIKDYLGTTYHEYERDQTRYGKTTYWYAMQLTEEEAFDPQKEEDIEKVAWVPLSDAKEKVDFDNLTKLLDRFEVWYLDFYETVNDTVD